MADKLTSQERSKLMSSVRNKNTKPELIVRRLLYSMEYRYRLHGKGLPGKPDIVFPGRKKAIFIHGCFWHHHDNCAKGSLPKSNLEYWKPKLERNKERDDENQNKLNSLGWKFVVIWQCDLKNIEAVKKKLIDFIEDG